MLDSSKFKNISSCNTEYFAEWAQPRQFPPIKKNNPSISGGPTNNLGVTQTEDRFD